MVFVLIFAYVVCSLLILIMLTLAFFLGKFLVRKEEKQSTLSMKVLLMKSSTVLAIVVLIAFSFALFTVTFYPNFYWDTIGKMKIFRGY
jgi:ABC-type multidrug transport system permease subunit